MKASDLGNYRSRIIFFFNVVFFFTGNLTIIVSEDLVVCVVLQLGHFLFHGKYIIHKALIISQHLVYG